ncbi:MAG: helix-turn-helix domain-containing protein [Chloroflexi bacterium]|nr:MAG: helix-turn-helix domain-containing protein [Chloroflexota bacterium]
MSTSLLVDINEAAALLSTGRRTVELLLARGELPSLLISRRARRIRRLDIDAYIARRLEADADQVQVEPVTPEASALIRKHRSTAPERKRPSKVA